VGASVKTGVKGTTMIRLGGEESTGGKRVGTLCCGKTGEAGTVLTFLGRRGARAGKALRTAGGGERFKS